MSVDQSVWECNANVYYYETADLAGVVSVALATSAGLSFPYYWCPTDNGVH